MDPGELRVEALTMVKCTEVVLVVLHEECTLLGRQQATGDNRQ